MKYLLYILCLFVLSCDSPSDIYGCTDQNACNYNSNVNIEDNDSCHYSDEEGLCDDLTIWVSLLHHDWKKSSQPISDAIYSKENRVDLFFYNPLDEVKTNEIWPDEEVTIIANNQTTRTLFLESDANPSYLSESSKYWAGITYPIRMDDRDLSKMKSLDIWMNVDVGHELEFHIDLGNISEDINQNGVLYSEDIPLFGMEGNGLLDEGEDVGLDGCEDIYEDGWGGCIEEELTYCESDNVNNYITNPDCTAGTDIDPNRDNYYYQFGGDDYSRINGTEGNGGDIDTEDLNGNNSLNTVNNYFTVSFNPNHHIANYNCWDCEESYVELESGVNSWKLYRIPLSDFEITAGNVEFNNIRTMRIWISTTNLSVANKIKIAEMQFVNLYGNTEE